VCLEVKPVGERSAGNSHAAFDERGRETGPPSATPAPFLDSTTFLLKGEIFYSLRETQVVIESWRRHHNSVRPHASLGFRPPAPEVILPTFAAWPAVLRQPASPTLHTMAPKPMLNYRDGLGALGKCRNSAGQSISEWEAAHPRSPKPSL
jgi:hypothetical protein